MDYLGINNKKTLVTAGNLGIGYAIAKLFLELGAEIHVFETKVEYST